MPAPVRVLSHVSGLLRGLLFSLPLAAVCACQGSRAGSDMVEADAADPVAAAHEAAVDDAGTHREAGATGDATIQVLPCQFGATSAGEFEVCLAAPDAALAADAATDAASLDATTPLFTDAALPDAALSDAAVPRDAASEAASADASCSAGAVDPQPLDSLLVVFDPSSAADLPFAGGLTRYQATRRALFDPSQGVLTQVQARLLLGAAASHAIDTPSCAQEMLGSDFMQALPQNAGRVEQAMLTLSTSGNMGTTDVAAAIGFALSSAQTNTGIYVGRAAQLLLINGTPTSCGPGLFAAHPTDFQTTVSIATQARARGVRTFVVGFTEADAGTVTFLHNVAAAGGTGRAFLPKTMEELQDALRQVVGLPVCGEK